MTDALRVVFFGTGSFGVPSLDALKSSKHQIVSVVTAVDKPSGRNLQSKPTPIKEWAIANSAPLFPEIDLKSTAGMDELRKLDADVFVVISFGMLLPKWILAIPKIAPLNVHSSLLPRHRGAAPVHWAIIAGDAESGVTVMRMTEKLDAGDVLVQKKTPVSPDDDIVSLDSRLSKLGGEAIVEALDLLAEGKAVFVPQDDKKTSYARKFSKDDGLINWDLDAIDVHNRVRALSVWPGRYFFFEGKRVIVKKSALLLAGTVPDAAPGTVMGAAPDGGLAVTCKKGAVSLLVLQAEGRRPMSAAQFLNGFPLKAGTVLE
jgi:methionyl-tRNA formyltransferase